MPTDAYRIVDEAALRAVVGEPMEFVRGKVTDRLNRTMQAFVTQSPLVFVTTIDGSGLPDVSPKGDPPGFVTVADDTTLLVPERPGNKLTFGFVNLLERPQIGLIFVVPGQLETLRVKGRATLHRDPEVLRGMAINGKPALLFSRITIEQCFFHCGKALVRSELWKPQSWTAGQRAIAARGMGAKDAPDAAAIERTEAALEKSYRETLY